VSYPFTFARIAESLQAARAAGYELLGCADYVARKASGTLAARTLVVRVDIDLSCGRAARLARVIESVGATASFFVRLHAPEYNPFAFENYRRLRSIRDAGHEIGYHSEVVDQARIWHEDEEACLRRDLDVLSRMLEVTIRGVASHRGHTPWNNLDFWRDRRPQDFGLLYEAYDRQPAFNLFQEAIYVSDSNWTSWTRYDRGQRRREDGHTLDDHLGEGHPLVYLLLHGDTYYDDHFYE
jgi:hypothetical protein